MNNSYDNELEELEVEEVFDAKELERELNEILEEDDEDIDDDRLDELDKLFAQKYEARKHKSVLQARRRKRQLKRMSIAAAVISVLLVVSVIAFFVALMRDATSTLKEHNTDILAETRDSDIYVGSDDVLGVQGTWDSNQTGVLGGTESGMESETESELLGAMPDESQMQSENQTLMQSESTNVVESTKVPESTNAVEPTKSLESTKPSEVTSVAPTQSSTPMQYVTISDSNVTAQFAALYDVSSGQLMAGKSPYAKMYPASMTKVMTLIVACENITDWNKSTTLTETEASYLLKENASRAGYASGEGDEAKDLIYGLILESGCDASVMLARIACGSEAAFVEKMNSKCKELGLKSTHFTNSTGLHDDNQYTTVADMCKIMNYAMNNSLCAKILGTYKYTTTFTNGKKVKNWVHNNIETYNKTLYTSNTCAMKALNNKGITVVGVKSGYTSDAGNCLVTCVEKNGKRYIAVVGNVEGKGQSTVNTTRILLNYLN